MSGESVTTPRRARSHPADWGWGVRAGRHRGPAVPVADEDEVGDVEHELTDLTVVDESRVADVGTIAGRPVYEPGGAVVEHVEDPDILGTPG